jgi:Flp pilus assembly protein TadG
MFWNLQSSCGWRLIPTTMVRGLARWRRLDYRRLRADENGVALVEFALVLPLLLVLLLGMIDVGKAVNYWNDETHLANEAARYAAVNNSPDPNWASNKTTAAYKINTAIKNQADTNELKQGGTQSISTPGATVCIYFPNGTHATGPKALQGEPVKVVVTAQYNWLGYLVGKGLLPHSTLTATSSMRLEQNYTGDGTDAYTTGTANNTDGSGTC